MGTRTKRDAQRANHQLAIIDASLHKLSFLSRERELDRRRRKFDYSFSVKGVYETGAMILTVAAIIVTRNYVYIASRTRDILDRLWRDMRDPRTNDDERDATTEGLTFSPSSNSGGGIKRLFVGEQSCVKAAGSQLRPVFGSSER